MESLFLAQNMSQAMRLSRAIRPLASTTQTARFSVCARKMAEGDSGAPRSGGSSQGDAFTKREEASENLYIKQQEQEKLRQLRAKISHQEEQLAKDKQQAADMEKK